MGRGHSLSPDLAPVGKVPLYPKPHFLCSPNFKNYFQRLCSQAPFAAVGNCSDGVTDKVNMLGKLSTTGQPTQPFILPRLINK